MGFFINVASWWRAGLRSITKKICKIAASRKNFLIRKSDIQATFLVITALTALSLPACTEEPAATFSDPTITTLQFIVPPPEGGPNGFLRAAWRTAPAGMTAGWRHAEDVLTRNAAATGDWAGVRSAQEYAAHMDYSARMKNIMSAYGALGAGDAFRAAQYLARTHAIFPGYMSGIFAVGADGKLYCQRIDEQDPSRLTGELFRVTQQDIALEIK